MDEVRLGTRTLQPGRQLLAGSRREPLGKRALDILSVLAEAGGAIVTKDELFEAVWPGVVVEENALQVHIVALRKALGPEADRLKTIRGVGYQLDIDGQAVAPQPGIAAASLPRDRAKPAMALTAMWGRLRPHRWAMALAALLLVLAGTWVLFGDELGRRPQERIPVVVRPLTAGASRDDTEAALASGITDELIVRLRQVPELRIGTANPDGSVGGDAFMNAYVVDGSIRSSGDRLRVTARLVSKDGEILWSQTFDSRLADLFEIQEEIASSIANTLSVSFDVGANSVEYGGTDDPEAYAAYMQYWTHRLDFDQSVPSRYLGRAVAIDPDFVKALGSLSQNYGTRVQLVSTRREANDLFAKMDDSSARALAAKPDLWIGHVARGWYYLARKDLSSAERHMRRAAELDEDNDPELRTSLAFHALGMGRVQEAISIRQSNELIDPIYRNEPWKVVDLMMLGKHQDSIDLFERLARAEERGLERFAFHAFFARLLLGEEAAAIEFAERGNYRFGEDLSGYDADKALLTMSPPELKQWADRRYGYGGQYQIGVTALYAAYRGHDRLALDLMALAFDRPGGFVLFILWHPAMAQARKTDAFEKLVTDLGLVKAWRESSDWGDYCRPVNATEITCH